MLTANCRLVIGEKGSDVPKTGITPAEYVILGLMHKANAGKLPITDLVIADEAALTEVIMQEENKDHEMANVQKFRPRTIMEEKRRLVTIYGKDRVAKLFPGAKPTFPVDFDEAKDMVIENEVDAAGEEDDDKGSTLFGTRAEAHAAAKAALRNRHDGGVGEAPRAPTDDN